MLINLIIIVAIGIVFRAIVAVDDVSTEKEPALIHVLALLTILSVVGLTIWTHMEMQKAEEQASQMFDKTLKLLDE